MKPYNFAGKSKPVKQLTTAALAAKERKEPGRTGLDNQETGSCQSKQKTNQQQGGFIQKTLTCC